MRWGQEEAHGKGAALQYAHFRKSGAVAWDEAAKRFRVDFAKLEEGVRDLTRDIVVVQGNGDYAGAKEMLATAVLDAEAKSVIAEMAELPIDIDPQYPERV
jgi:hypothetical protein